MGKNHTKAGLFKAALSFAQVKAVRAEYRKDRGKTRARATTYETLAKKFKVSVATIRNVVKYKGTYGGAA